MKVIDNCSPRSNVMLGYQIKKYPSQRKRCSSTTVSSAAAATSGDQICSRQPPDNQVSVLHLIKPDSLLELNILFTILTGSSMCRPSVKCSKWTKTALRPVWFCTWGFNKLPLTIKWTSLELETAHADQHGSQQTLHSTPLTNSPHKQTAIRLFWRFFPCLVKF